MWTSNPNQFVEDEDDDTFSFSVRIAAQDVLLVRNILACFKILLVNGFSSYKPHVKKRKRPLLSCFAWDASMK